ncbi:MAG: hypothetical protein IJ764_01635 [Bacteroidales bacterium]|nr:hypothetical protein [Bacteroidales bacterium]
MMVIGLLAGLVVTALLLFLAAHLRGGSPTTLSYIIAVVALAVFAFEVNSLASSIEKMNSLKKTVSLAGEVASAISVPDNVVGFFDKALSKNASRKVWMGIFYLVISMAAFFALFWFTAGDGGGSRGSRSHRAPARRHRASRSRRN